MSASGLATAFGLGAIYFIAAIPAGIAAGAGAWTVAVAAALGYTAGGGGVLVAGAPLRAWLVCLVAPVTIGPQATAVIALAVGERTPKIAAFIALGVVPWCVAFALLTAFGFKLAS